jgi:hypothetical protein
LGACELIFLNFFSPFFYFSQSWLAKVSRTLWEREGIKAFFLFPLLLFLPADLGAGDGAAGGGFSRRPPERICLGGGF